MWGGVSVVRDAEESKGISKDISSVAVRKEKKKYSSVGSEAAETVVKDGRSASVDALPWSRHGRTPRPGAAYAGWHWRDGRGGKKAGHRRHITANNDHHRPKPGRSSGQVTLQKSCLHFLDGKWQALFITV